MAARDLSFDAVADDIATMRVRGAGAIARHAVAGLAAWERDVTDVPDARDFDAGLRRAVRRLTETRPTAVSLGNALRFVQARVAERGTVEAKREALRAAVHAFDERSRAAVKAINAAHAELVTRGGTFLTHCNSQAALGGFIEARAAGANVQVIATETRPWRQGLLTARQLQAGGVPTTLIVDSAAHHEMPRVDGVFVGCDTIAANGDVINKVGTSTLALLAREFDVPFYVCGESYKVDVRTPSGAEVTIEERDVAEVVDPADLPGVRILNPVFDVTPHRRVTGIITEEGVGLPSDVRAVAEKAWGW